MGKERMIEIWKLLKTNQQEGIGVIEIILILVIIIGLVLIFREQITDILNKIFSSISGDVDTIITP